MHVNPEIMLVVIVVIAVAYVAYVFRGFRTIQLWTLGGGVLSVIAATTLPEHEQRSFVEVVSVLLAPVLMFGGVRALLLRHKR